MLQLVFGFYVMFFSLAGCDNRPSVFLGQVSSKATKTSVITSATLC